MNKLLKKTVAFTTVGVMTIMGIMPAMNLRAEEPSSVTDVQTELSVTQFMDCFLPMPIIEPLSSDCWGALEVGRRDQGNGLEDGDMSDYAYWDGGIIQDDGTGEYYMFASRWDESTGHEGWKQSVAVYATSDDFYGPYEDQGLLWPDDQGGKGHNAFPLTLQDDDPNGKYAIVLSDTRPGAIYVSDSLDGPWKFLGQMQMAEGSDSFNTTNTCIIARPDGKYEAFSRPGDIAIADTIAGPWTVQTKNLWSQVPGMPTGNIEDPVIWYAEDLYHCVVNKWDARQSYYLTSKDGIHNWRLHPGKAYTPDDDFLRYENGTINKWNKIERPNVYAENGKVTAMTFSVVDVSKNLELGGDQHGSKIIVVPFDGEALNEFAKRPDPIIDRKGDNTIADTTAHSWKQEAAYNYGGRNHVRLQRNNAQASYGLFGEKLQGGSGTDCKIGYLKFDISGYSIDEIENASLSLVYTRKFAGTAGTERIQVALADPNWNEGVGNENNTYQAGEGVLIWNHQPAIIYNPDNIINTTAVSDEFSTAKQNQVINVDITKLIKTLNPSETTLSLALCETVGNQQIGIASKENREGYAPKLTITETVNPSTSVTGLTVNPKELTLNTGEHGEIAAEVAPATATNRNVTWTSGDNSIAAVDSEGNVTAKAAGTTVITAETEDGGFKAECIIIVKEKDHIVSAPVIMTNPANIISIANDVVVSVSLYTVTTSASIYYTLDGSEPTATTDSMYTIDFDVKAPSQSGGEVIINAKAFKESMNSSATTNKTIKFLAAVPVNEAVTSIVISGQNGASSITNKSGVLHMTANVLPANATDKSVTWSVENETGSATINAYGVLTAVSNGTVTVKATSISNPSVAGTCTITIFGQNSSSGSNSGSSNQTVVTPVTPVVGTNPADPIKKVEQAIQQLPATDKKEIEKQSEKYLPYTLIATKGLSMEQLAKLTNNKFTKEEMEAMLNQPKLLKKLGIDTTNRSTSVTLKPIKNASFTDVKVSHWANEAIKKAAELGLVAGRPDGSFAPSEFLKVPDAFTFLDRILLLNNISESNLPRSVVEKYITDKESWAFSNMASVGSKLNEETLKTITSLEDQPLSRELLAQVLYELTNGKLKATKKVPTFTDTKNSSYKEAIDYCVSVGLLNATGKGTMSPQKALTRAELMSILIRMDNLLE